MSVSEVEQIEYEDWGAYLDPRFPERLWKCRLEVTGDASGGNRILTMIIANAPDSRVPLFYSLEEVWILDTDETALVVTLQTNNLGSARTGPRPIVLGFNIVQMAGAVGLSAQEADGLLKPGGLFLGSQRDNLTVTSLQWSIANRDGELFQMFAGGYVWGPRSRSAGNGGLQRPPNGLYGV